MKGRSLATALLVALLLTACSGDDDDSAEAQSDPTVASTTTSTTIARPEGPAADVSEELTGGEGMFIGTARPGELESGYVEAEYVATGTATSCRSTQEPTADGHWTVEPDAEAEYRTRVLVRRPETPTISAVSSSSSG